MMEDAELLRRFAEERSEAAFRELVARRIDFVYATALRQVWGDAALAEDVAQGVFLDLARKAPVLARRPSLTGWLYTSARFAAAKARRARSRRLSHETEAHAMDEILTAPARSEVDWNELRPVIDAALHELGEHDREAILLRYFEGRSLAEVGAATGLAENSARMRVDRALEKLRTRLARRGVTSTAAALGVALAAQPAVAAPAGMAAAVAGVSLAGAATAGTGLATTLATLNFMNTTKFAVGAVGALFAVGLSAYLGMNYQAGRAEAQALVSGAPDAALAALRDENQRLKAQLVQPSGGEAVGSPVAAGPKRAAESGLAAPARAGEWTMLADLQRRRLATPEIQFVGPDKKLGEAFVKVFELTPAEAQTLQQSLDRATEQLAMLERQNATVSRDPSGGVIIAVRPFPETGGAVYDEVLKAFAQTLGPDRNAAFLTLGAGEVEKELGRFGVEQRTVTVTRVPASGPGGDAGQIMVRDMRKAPNGTNNSTSGFPDLTQAAGRLGALAPLLPPDF